MSIVVRGGPGVVSPPVVDGAAVSAAVSLVVVGSPSAIGAGSTGIDGTVSDPV